MKVSYDLSIPLVGIGVVPWARLGLERWFDKYEILSIHDWDLEVDKPRVRKFQPNQPLSANNAQSIVKDVSFHQLANEEYKHAYFIPYKPVDIFEELQGRMLMNDPHFTSTYENKAVFREMFVDKLNFAPYKIIQKNELLETKEYFEELQNLLGQELVLQHESLSGGKGTYLVGNVQEYKTALNALPQGRVVVSRRILDGRERSVQACATKYGTLVGPIQKQIIRDPQICKLGIKDVRMFCGGEVGTANESPEAMGKLQEAAKIIGDQLYKNGFRGIFGVDALIKDEQVYILEANVRLTGMTPLLTAMFEEEKSIPYYLLHVLELGSFKYEIKDFATESQSIGGQIILQSHADEPQILRSTIHSGIYTYDKDNGLKLERRDHSFSPEDERDRLLIQSYVPKGALVKPADRLAVIFTRRPVLGDDESITDYYRHIIAAVYEMLELKNIEK